MEAIKNNVNTFFQNPEVSAEDQLAPLPMEITLTLNAIMTVIAMFTTVA